MDWQEKHGFEPYDENGIMMVQGHPVSRSFSNVRTAQDFRNKVSRHGYDYQVGKTPGGQYLVAPSPEQHRKNEADLSRALRVLAKARREARQGAKEFQQSPRYPNIAAAATQNWPYDHTEKHRQAALKGHRK